MCITPKVTIIIATYNRASFILESIRSIQAQTFQDWECIVVDDGGNDNTKDVLASILLEDLRFNYLIRSELHLKGLPGSRNYGLDLAKGEYIIFFDDDDIAHPQNLEICVKMLSHSTFYFCRYIREVFVDDFDYSVFDYSETFSSFIIDKRDIFKIITNELQFNSCAVMWKRECFTNNKFTETLMYAEEWELYSRIIAYGFKGISIDKTLFYGRKHLNSNTGEFYANNKIRRQSNADAIVLVLSNLKNSGLISNQIIRHFIQIALDYKEYDLYCRINTRLELSLINNLKWKVTYLVLPLRLFFYKYYKNMRLK